MSVKFISHADEVYKELDDKVIEWLEAIGLDAAGTTTTTIANIPLVQTGRLMNSISHQVDIDRYCVYIGTNVEYAPYQEFGTSRGIKGKHFLQFGCSAHIEEYKRMLERTLKG